MSNISALVQNHLSEWDVQYMLSMYWPHKVNSVIESHTVYVNMPSNRLLIHSSAFKCLFLDYYAADLRIHLQQKDILSN